MSIFTTAANMRSPAADPVQVEELARTTAAAYARIRGIPVASPPRGAPAKGVAEALAKGRVWAAAIDCPSAAAVNAKIASDGGSTNTVLLAEAWHDGQIVDVAHAIQVKQEATRNAVTPLSLVLIAGPSSSGKTTFCSKLSMHLRSAGIKPETLSTDDYFLAREDPRHPRDESGNLNFATIDTEDVERLNADLKSLFTGRAVETPIFDFVVGAPGLKTRRKVLPTGGVLIMEGIFCLNPKLTPHIDRASKFNVFIAPLSPLKLKDGSDSREDIVRLVRRISRDYLHRGNSALHTIRKYDSVRVGELDNIFPFVGEADQMYNSSLLYETNVLKPKVKPLLEQISAAEAGPQLGLVQEVLSFLDSFDAVPDNAVPNTSVLMEFIGTSVFE